MRGLYARGERKRQLQLRTAATRPPPLDSLRIRFYRSLLLSLFISSLPPTPSFARLSFPPASSAQRSSSPRRTSATRLRPSLFTAAVTRTHTHTRTQGRARPRGPPDSSPAPRQTPNGPTATVDTLPNFSTEWMGRRKGGGRRLPAESRDSNRFHDTRVITLPKEYFSESLEEWRKICRFYLRETSDLENNSKRIREKKREKCVSSRLRGILEAI